MSSGWIEIQPDICDGRPVLEVLTTDGALEAFLLLGREQALACVDYKAGLMGKQYSFEPAT